jgi:hypothetical protein
LVGGVLGLIAGGGVEIDCCGGVAGGLDCDGGG